MPTTWFIWRDGKQHGPITEIEFRKLIELGHLRDTDLVWHEGAADWMPATQFLDRQTEEDAPPRIARAAKPEPARSDGASPRDLSSRAAEATSPQPRRPWLAVVPVVVLVLSAVAAYNFVGPKVYERLFRPKADRATVERQLLAHPKSKWLQILRKKQPEAYSKYVDALTARLQRGEPLEDSINYLRKAYVEPIYTANAPHLDDEAMTRYIKLTADYMAHFSQTNPRLCVRMFRGEPMGDVRAYLTEALLDRELRLLEEALLADKTKARPRYTQAEQAKFMQAILAKLQRKHGDLVRLIDPAATVDGRERDVCTIGEAFFREIASLPARNAAALMRSLLSASN